MSLNVRQLNVLEVQRTTDVLVVVCWQRSVGKLNDQRKEPENKNQKEKEKWPNGEMMLNFIRKKKVDEERVTIITSN